MAHITFSIPLDMKTDSSSGTNRAKDIAFILFAVLLLLVRKSDSLFNPQLWAEDGTVFFAQQYEHGLASMFTTYAGYLHIVPRLIAFMAETFFPYALIPAVYNYTALIITIIVIAHCFSPRLLLPQKPLLALFIVLVPQPRNEVFLNITNIQWLLCLLLVLTLLKESPDKKYGSYPLQVISDILIIILAGLSGPFMVLMLPFFAWKLFNLKNSYGYTMLTLACCAALVQVFFLMMHNETIQGGSVFDADAYISMFARKLFGGLFFGYALKYGNAIGTSIGALVYFSLLVYISYSKSPDDRYCMTRVLLLLGIAAAIVGAAIIRYNFSPLILVLSGYRYFYVPYVLVAWSIIMCLDQRRSWKNIFVFISLVLILYSSLAFGFRTAMVDHQWKSHARLIGSQDTVNIPINPYWIMTLTNKKK